MSIELNNIIPNYMSDAEIKASDVYLVERVVFEKGKTYLIKANSGHGKSSVLNFIYGSNANFSGRIKYQGESTNTSFNLRKSKISYVFQDFKLFPDLTVFENIQLKNTLTDFKSPEEIDRLIEKVQLGAKRDSLVQKLSLGQKQRVAIIRALCQPFEFFLLDEPFSHLDEENIAILTTIIKEEIDKQEASLIMTSLVDSKLFDFDKVLNL